MFKKSVLILAVLLLWQTIEMQAALIILERNSRLCHSESQTKNLKRYNFN